MQASTQPARGAVPRATNIFGNPTVHENTAKSEGKDGLSFGVFRTPVLEVNSGELQVRIRNKRPNILYADLKRGFGERLYRSACNMARQKSFSLESRVPRSTCDVDALLNELAKKSKENITLLRDIDGNLRVVYGEYLTCEELYFLPIAPIEDMRKPLKDLMIKFVKTLQEGFKLDDITRQDYFDYVKDIAECNVEEIEKHPENYEKEDLDKYKTILKNYSEKGASFLKLRKLDKIKPASRKEIESFETESQKEEELKQCMLGLMSLIESGFQIWNKVSSKNFFTMEDYAEAEEDGNYEIIWFEKICTIIYDYDEMTDMYSQVIQDSYQCGAISEYLVNFEELTEESEFKESDNTKTFIKLYEQLVILIQSSELQEKRKKPELKKSA